MFEPLKSLMGSVLKRAPIREGVRTAVVLDAARETIEALFPAGVHADIEARVFRNGTLVLGVRHPALAQEVRLRSSAFLRLVNERLGEPIVTRLQMVRSLPRQES